MEALGHTDGGALFWFLMMGGGPFPTFNGYPSRTYRRRYCVQDIFLGNSTHLAVKLCKRIIMKHLSNVPVR